jgi:polar amino acid transport system permease protein
MGLGLPTRLLVPLGRRNSITAAKFIGQGPADDTSARFLEYHPGDTNRFRHGLYVELIRNVPPIVFIFVFYFFISSQIIPLLGLDTLDQRLGPTGQSVVEFLFGPVSLLSNTFSGIFCLALFEAAYITEIVRSGIQSVSVGQREAAMSIGLSRWQQMRYVVLPQAVQRVIPPLAGQFIILIKDSSIVSLISIQELTFLTLEVANSTQRVFEVWVFVAGVYFVLCYSCALIFRRLEMRLDSSRI